ncbi:MocR-like transcription factor YczR [Marmoricola sp. RAF53]|uniref:MocR-like transcription factor YczR n=1 Tax=Marmoricola sp. RAF53 TaxID=3233059 RepID=UPI003F9C75C1
MSARAVAARTVAGLVGDFHREPAYRGLAEALRVLITDGRVPVGVRMPSERELTEALQVSRTTVTRAYAELRDHGYLVSRQGSGSVASLPESRAFRGDHLLFPGDARADEIDLTCAAANAGPGILAAYERAVGDLPAYLGGSGYYPSGLPVLREAVAERFTARGLPTTPEQVMVVPGALSGVAIAARALGRRGTRTLLESPTYPNAIATLRQTGTRLLSSPIGREVADVADLLRSLDQVRPDLAYLVPDFHNPTGHLLSDESRERVAARLRQHGTVAIVDESMVELGLDGDPMPLPLAAHLPDAITVGSVSKPFWGGLRVGWLRAPAERMDAMVRSRLSLDLGVPVLEQLVTADLLRNGAPLLAQKRALLRESREAALDALAVHLPAWQVRRPAGGLSLWCELPAAHSTDLLPRAADRGVLLAPGPSFAPEGGLDRFLRVPFTQPAHVLTAAIERLAEAWKETLADPLGRGSSEPTMVA